MTESTLGDVWDKMESIEWGGKSCVRKVTVENGKRSRKSW